MQKYKQIKVNLLEDDYKLLVKKAIDSEVSMAEYIRRSLKVYIPNTRKRNININHKKVNYYLLKIGNNINQIAKSLNTILNTPTDNKTSSSNLTVLSLNKNIYEDIKLCKIYLHNLSIKLL